MCLFERTLSAVSVLLFDDVFITVIDLLRLVNRKAELCFKKLHVKF